MSRDFTPRERYMVSMKMDPSYFMLNVKVKYGPADEEKSLFSEEEKQVILHYPIFGRAAPELLLSLKKEGEKDPEKMNLLLYTVEDDLKIYGDGIAEMEDEIDPALKKWFDGKLDPFCVRDFCEFCGYTESEFWKIVDGFYNRDLFYKNEYGEWVLKHPIWEEKEE